MFFALVILSLISLIECTFKSHLGPVFNANIEKKPKFEKMHFTKDQRVEQFLKTMQSFEAFNLKQKYELGRTVAQIIHSMRLEQNGGAKVKKAKNSSMEEAAVEADVVDKNPEESWRTAETLIKAYKESGWDAIKTELRGKAVYVRSKVLIRAIADEEVALVKSLIEGKYSIANIEKYNFAVRNYMEKGTDKCEEIVDFIEENNPELGAAVCRNDKLQSAWDQVKVQQYIYENNYPMLRRALDNGFDHDFVYENQGNLLGLAVVARCYRCVKMLVERGAEVNEPIQIGEKVNVKGWEESVSVKGWTPLMFAVADGNVRIVKELIESGSAIVSKTGNEQEEPRFHARAAARKIEKDDLRFAMLDILHLSGSETTELKSLVNDENFTDIVKSGDIAKLDAFFLLKPLKLFDYPTKVTLAKGGYTQSIKTMLDSEGVEFHEI